MSRRAQPGLFGSSSEPGRSPQRRADRDPGEGPAPLAERMRPRSVEELVGQSRALAAGGFLDRMLRGGPPAPCILWGPPGSGKTTIARLLAAREDTGFEQISAVLSGVKDVREVIERARLRRRSRGQGTFLFVDEIHRFNKAQQDAFLPHVEDGTIVLVGATTENPSFELTAPLLSRCRVVVLESLSEQDVRALILRAVRDARGLAEKTLVVEEAAVSFLASAARGDARVALGALEVAAALAEAAAGSADRPRVTLETAEQGLQAKPLAYDKQGDQHFAVVSAFIKSMRASKVDASLYWLARMLEAGEDPLFVARRMVVFASEDVGLADPRALSLAVAVKDAVAFVGMPEARIHLAHGAAYLAAAPKSNTSFAAFEAAAAEVRTSGALPVPDHLRNASTGLMKRLGYGRGYVSAHQDPQGAQAANYLPEGLGRRRFVPEPSESPQQPDESGTRKRRR